MLLQVKKKHFRLYSNSPANIYYILEAFDVCNTLRSKLSSFKVIIIDKISMVGRKIMSQVNNRLKAIMENSLDFGGVSIICVGDFHQLRPVNHKSEILKSGSNGFPISEYHNKT